MVINAIPSELRQLLGNDIDEKPNLDFSLKLEGINIKETKCNNNYLRMICQICSVHLAIGLWRSQFQDVNWKETFKISRRFVHVLSIYFMKNYFGAFFYFC